MSFEVFAISNSGQICTSAVEDCRYLFRLCPLAFGAWHTSQFGIISSTTPYIPFKDCLIGWLLYFRRQDEVHVNVSLFLLLTCGSLGEATIIKFSPISTRHLETIRHLVQQYLQQHHSFILLLVLRYVPPKGSHLPPGFIMATIGNLFRGIPEVYIQVDGSWKASTPLAGIIWVAQNISTNFDTGQGTCIYDQSPPHDLITGLPWCTSLGPRSRISAGRHQQ